MTDRLLALIFRKKPLALSTSPSGRAEPVSRVLVVGLGPAGRQVVQTLVARRLETVIIDVNPKSREYARQQSLNLHLGDAGQVEVLMHAGLPEVCMVVVTIPDPHAAAGPNKSEATTGIALAGRSSENPGMRGMPTLNGIRIAA